MDATRERALAASVRQNISRIWVNEVSFSCGVLVFFALKIRSSVNVLTLHFQF